MDDGERRLGLTIHNVYSKVSGDTDDTMPLEFRVGISDQYFKKKLLLALDIDKSVNANPDMHVGGEFACTKNFKGRFGLQVNQADGLQETHIGFGYTIKSL